MELFKILFLAVVGVMILKVITSVLMGLFGVRWQKGLIGMTGCIIGFNAGFVTAMHLYFRLELGEISFIVIPIETIICGILAYRNLTFNHFLVGFLVADKISFLILEVLMDNNVIDFDLGILVIIPVVVGIIVGCIGCKFFVYKIMISCLALISAINLEPIIEKWVNRGLFATTGDVGFVLETDPTKLILQVIGIEVPSLLGCFLMILLFGIFFAIHYFYIKKQGLELSEYVINDRKLND